MIQPRDRRALASCSVTGELKYIPVELDSPSRGGVRLSASINGVK